MWTRALAAIAGELRVSTDLADVAKGVTFTGFPEEKRNEHLVSRRCQLTCGRKRFLRQTGQLVQQDDRRSGAANGINLMATLESVSEAE
jgi:hypothetical protein